MRVLVHGAAGRMGREVVRAVAGADDMELCAAVDHSHTGEDLGDLTGAAAGITMERELQAALERTRPDVMIDFTVAESAREAIAAALRAGTAPVTGTTGLGAADLEAIDRLAREKSVGAFLAPNFAIGAVLLMQFAEQAARWMPDVEIIELHHEKKVDSPSGTALLTARRIGAARRAANASPAPQPAGLVEKVPGARGARDEETGDVPVHSVRLPGFVASQEVVFGATGQVLSLRHDSTDRTSFMPGVLLAARRVRELTGLVIGLDHLL